MNVSEYSTARRRNDEATIEHFHLDGQMAPVLDYLEVYPEHQELIAAASHLNKLSLGPWYIPYCEN
jgi:alpha-mannosidase